jgi:uncharacterized protein (DUF1778 family)
MANPKSRRLELRTDESTGSLITEAAELLHVTKSAFVADAARQTAQKVASRDLGAFDCGDPAYNQWLTEHAMQAVDAGASMVTCF